MAKIFFRKNGNRTSYEDIEGNVIVIFKFAKKLRDLFKKKYNIKIEINFVEHGTLINELLKDHRLIKEEIEKGRKGLERFAGYHIEYKEMPGNFLKKEYSQEKICYVSLIDNTDYLIINLLHEIFHFISPFDESEIYKNCLKFNKNCFIKMGVRNLLNEYYADFRSFGYFLIYAEEYRDEKNSLIIKILEDSGIHLIQNLSHTLFDKLKSHNYDEYTEYELLHYFIEWFFKSIIYFLGRYQPFKLHEYHTENVERVWNNFIKDIQNDVSNGLAEFINTLKKDLLTKPKYKPKILIRYFDLIFLRFFETEYEEILNQIYGETRLRKIKDSLFLNFF